MARFLVVLLAILICAGCRQESGTGAPESLLRGREAWEARNMYAAREAYKAYLAEERAGEARYEAWDRLVEAELTLGNELEAGEMLSAMSLEFDGDARKKKRILQRAAEVYEATRQWAKLVRVLREQLYLHTLTPSERGRVQLELGRIYALRQEEELALSAYRECIETGADAVTLSECFLAWGSLCLDMDDLARAQEVFARLQALEGAPEETRVMALVLVGDWLEGKDRRGEALEMFRQARDRYPNPAAIERRIERLERQR